MIKVMVGYKLKRNADIEPVIPKLRTHAMTYPGFISAENLASEKDISIVVTISTWQRPDDWRVWESSKIRQAILREAEPLLEEEPRATIYRPMPIVRWVG
jgi:antibiotic biosynthesis monooxygenase (ABM) superfamily enzyme